MQLTLPITNSPCYKIDDFIVSLSNKEAFEAITNWPSGFWGVEPNKFTLLLSGPRSSGKTFLTKIWQRTSNAYLISPNEQLTSKILSENSAFIIDELSDVADEKELLHCFNLINEHNKYLLVTSSLPIPIFKLNDLASRFNALLKITINHPDDELVKILLFKNFSSLSIIVSPKILKFLASNLPRQFDKIFDITNKINQVALSSNRKITIPLIRKVIC